MFTECLSMVGGRNGDEWARLRREARAHDGELVVGSADCAQIDLPPEGPPAQDSVGSRAKGTVQRGQRRCEPIRCGRWWDERPRPQRAVRTVRIHHVDEEEERSGDVPVGEHGVEGGLEPGHR